MEIQEGLWFTYSNFIYGVKASEEKFKELWEEVKKASKDCDESSRIFRLHEDWSSLNGWWIDDQDNPKGLVLGTELYYFGLEEMENDDLNPEKLSGALNEVKEFWEDFGQLDEIISLLEDENIKPTLHLITARHFISKKDMTEKYENYPSLYAHYKDFLEADTWEIREIV